MSLKAAVFMDNDNFGQLPAFLIKDGLVTFTAFIVLLKNTMCLVLPQITLFFILWHFFTSVVPALLFTVLWTINVAFRPINEHFAQPISALFNLMASRSGSA
jgi:hypothetical protein